MPAPQIGEGGVLEDAVGGGVSQVATTVFNAAFFAGLRIVTHTPHGFWITRYPAGREATVSWGGPELIVRERLAGGVLLKAYDTGTSLTVQMYSAKLGRSVSTETIGDPVEGTAFSVDYTRVVREGGDGEARRALVVVLRGPAGLTSRSWTASATPSRSCRRSRTRSSGPASARPRWCSSRSSSPSAACAPTPTPTRHGRGPGNLSLGGQRVHHMVPGIFLLLGSGFIAVTAEDDSLPWYLWWLLPTAFGVGAALVLDEFALWLKLRDVYWTEEGRRSIDAVIIAAALIAIVALGAPFWGKVISGADPAGGFLIVAYHGRQRGLGGHLPGARASWIIGVIGFLLWPVGLVGALRLARARLAVGAAVLRATTRWPAPGRATRTRRRRPPRPSRREATVAGAR